MTTQKIEIVVSASGTVSVKRDIREIGKSAKEAESDVSDLKNALTALVSAATIKTIIGMADAWTDYTARVNLAAGSSEKGALVMDRLVQIADDTYSSIEQTTEAYLSNSTALRELGYSTNNMLDYTAALNDAFVVSGLKGQRAETVMTALSKSMASGKLSGENLNTVIQQGGRVAELLAEKLGVGINSLAAMGVQGKITSDVIYNALVGSMEKLRAEAETMPTTVGDAMVQLRNSIMVTIGEFDAAYGVTEKLAAIIMFAADNFGILATALSPVIAGMLLFAGASVVGFAINMLTQLVTTIRLVTTAFALLTTAMLTNPFALIGVAIAGIIVAMLQWKDSIEWVNTLYNTVADSVYNAFVRVREIMEEFGILKEGSLEVKAVDGGLGHEIRQALDDGGVTAGRNIVKEMEEAEEKKKKDKEREREQERKEREREEKEKEEKKKKDDEERRKRDEAAKKKADDNTRNQIINGHSQGADTIAQAISGAGSDLSATMIAAFEYGGAYLMDKFETMFSTVISQMEAQTRLLNAQAAQAYANAAKASAEAAETRKYSGNINRDGSYGAGGGGGGTYGGGGGGGGSGSMTISTYRDTWLDQFDRYDPNGEKKRARELAEAKERERLGTREVSRELISPPSERTIDVSSGSSVTSSRSRKSDDDKSEVKLDVTNNNILDPNSLLHAIGTQKGKETIINILRAYPDEFKQALGYA